MIMNGDLKNIACLWRHRQIKYRIGMYINDSIPINIAPHIIDNSLSDFRQSMAFVQFSVG